MVGSNLPVHVRRGRFDNALGLGHGSRSGATSRQTGAAEEDVLMLQEGIYDHCYGGP